MSAHLHSDLISYAMFAIVVGIALLVLRIRFGLRLIVAGGLFLFAVSALPHAGGVG